MQNDHHSLPPLFDFSALGKKDAEVFNTGHYTFVGFLSPSFLVYTPLCSLICEERERERAEGCGELGKRAEFGLLFVADLSSSYASLSDLSGTLSWLLVSLGASVSNFTFLCDGFS